MKNYIYILIMAWLSLGIALAQDYEPDSDKNSIRTKSYRKTGEVQSANVVYYDQLGNIVQSLNWDSKTGYVLGNQTFYDYHGRPFMSTSIAPIELSTDFSYRQGLLTNPDGSTYDPLLNVVPDPENPTAAGDGIGTIGWYFSENNTLDEYQDVTPFPFAISIYDDDYTGKVRKKAGGKKLEIAGVDSWGNGYSHSMSDPMAAYYLFGSGYFEENTDEIDDLYGEETEVQGILADINKQLVTPKIIKNVVISPEGIVSISLSDGDDKSIGVGKSGSLMKPTLSLIGPEGWVDIHIVEEASDNISYLGNMGDYQVVDLIAGQPIATTSSLPPGIYRISAALSENPALMYIDKNTGTIEPVYAGAHGVRYNLQLKDFALSYFNQTGKLISSLQPNGFDDDYVDLTQDSPNHDLAFQSTITYNTAGQVIETTSPDAGTARFAYRKDGSIRFSQHDEQLTQGTVSYTNYDAFGRPIEIGLMILPGGTTFSDLDPDAVLPGGGSASEVSLTIYDSKETITVAPGIDYTQTFTVGGSVISKKISEHGTTYFSYDYQGKLKWLVIENDLGEIKTIDYVYDPITNLLISEDYQRNVAAERFIHKYTYDPDDHTITQVEISIDDVTYENVAEYIYSFDGDLIEENISEGLYTANYIHGSTGLKAINASSLKNSGSTNTFAMQLNRFPGDYSRNVTGVEPSNYGKPQINGNLSSMVWRTPDQASDAAPKVYTYDYDKESGWLKSAKFGHFAAPENANAEDVVTIQDVVSNGETVDTQAGESISLQPGFHAQPGADFIAQIVNNDGYYENEAGEYAVTGLDYDDNGNILSLKRNAYELNGDVDMDDLVYEYIPGTNKLLRVEDQAVDRTDIDDDFESQTDPANYVYNSIGQLIEDKSKNISYSYTTSGQVSSIVKKGSPLVEFDYVSSYMITKRTYHPETGAPLGTTRYVRDASGKVIAIYQDDQLKEHPIYAGSRIGTYYRQDDRIVYEIKDHLGNVRGTIVDDDLDPVVFTASMESENAANEESLFSNVSETRISYAIADANVDGGDEVASLSVGQPIGPAITIPVLPGESFSVEVYGYYEGGSGYSVENSANVIADALAAAFGGVNGGTAVEQMNYDVINNAYVGGSMMVHDNTDDGLAAGYLNYMLMDTHGAMQQFGFVQLSAAADGAHELLSMNDITVSQPGYVYAWVSYESTAPNNVYFDDFSLTLNPTPLNATSDYYPFGSTHPSTGITKAIEDRYTDGKYRYGYQGQEYDSLLDNSIFQLRLYDARIGRWLTTDPYKQFASPYLAMGNNPMNGVDEDGGFFNGIMAYLYWALHGFQGQIEYFEAMDAYGITSSYYDTECDCQGYEVMFGFQWEDENINSIAAGSMGGVQYNASAMFAGINTNYKLMTVEYMKYKYTTEFYFVAGIGDVMGTELDASSVGVNIGHFVSYYDGDPQNIKKGSFEGSSVGATGGLGFSIGVDVTLAGGISSSLKDEYGGRWHTLYLGAELSIGLQASPLGGGKASYTPEASAAKYLGSIFNPFSRINLLDKTFFKQKD